TDINEVGSSCSSNNNNHFPDPISNLRVSVPGISSDQTLVEWGLPSDDISHFLVYWEQTPITESNIDNFAGTPIYDIENKEIEGAYQASLIGGFDSYSTGTEWYFAVRAVDLNGNISPISNVERIISGTDIKGQQIGGVGQGSGNSGNEDLFRMKLLYEDGLTDLNSNAEAQYNGNITGMIWQTPSDCKVKGYAYTYDHMNRLKRADYAVRDVHDAWTIDVDRYTVSNLTYDFNGNVLFLDRMGLTGSDPNLQASYGLMDQLSYTYLNGNQLLGVQDGVGQFTHDNHFIDDAANTSNDYTYDASGNLTQDNNKGIVIEYNYWDQPTKIIYQASSNNPQSTIEYVYSFSGEKLRQIMYDQINSTTNVTDYVHGFQYESQDITNAGYIPELKHFGHSEGRVRYTGTEFVYEYNLTDHLGNVRVSFADTDGDWKPEILSETHYYPFGLSHSGAYQINDNQYLYNGKERQDELGLNWYDYGARMYNAAIARWNGVDRMATKYALFSPYNYNFNSPNNFIDPSGMDPISIINNWLVVNWNEIPSDGGYFATFSNGRATQGMGYSVALNKEDGQYNLKKNIRYYDIYLDGAIFEDNFLMPSDDQGRLATVTWHIRLLKTETGAFKVSIPRFETIHSDINITPFVNLISDELPEEADFEVGIAFTSSGETGITLGTANLGFSATQAYSYDVRRYFLLHISWNNERLEKGSDWILADIYDNQDRSKNLPVNRSLLSPNEFYRGRYMPRKFDIPLQYYGQRTRLTFAVTIYQTNQSTGERYLRDTTSPRDNRIILTIRPNP
ncbi:MAG: RHS repeat-associated core domain-containing protein, partial [Bacteroidota bacterium]